MEEEQYIIDLKNSIKGLDKISLLDMFAYIEEIIKECEDQNTIWLAVQVFPIPH